MISDKLKRIILTELDLDDWPIDETTTAGRVPGWDSLSHSRVVTAIEDAYGIRFRTAEIIRVKNVGELQQLIETKSS